MRNMFYEPSIHAFLLATTIEKGGEKDGRKQGQQEKGIKETEESGTSQESSSR
jgi:hypothetical protein